MTKFDISVIEYLGRLEDGIMVLLGVMYDGSYYDATFFYTSEDMVVTVSDELEEIIGDVTRHPEYKDILLQILRKVVPFSEMWPTLNEIDFTQYIQGQVEVFGDDIAEILPKGSVRKLG